jgi:hypothetical protein
MAQYSHLSEPDPELTSIPSISGPITPDTVPIVRQTFDVPLEKRLDLYKTRLPSGAHIFAGLYT